MSFQIIHITDLVVFMYIKLNTRDKGNFPYLMCSISNLSFYNNCISYVHQDEEK